MRKAVVGWLGPLLMGLLVALSVGLAVGAGIGDATAAPPPLVVHCPLVAGQACTQSIDGQTVTWPPGTTVVR
jgi:hypothetical protein